MKGTEAEVYVKKATKSKTKAVEQKIASKKGDWRKKHEDFINAIRAGKFSLLLSNFIQKKLII